MKRIDYTGVIDKIRAYGITAFYRDAGIGGKMNFVYNLEHGGNMTMKSLDELCRFFHCGVEDLISLKEDAEDGGAACAPQKVGADAPAGGTRRNDGVDAPSVCGRKDDGTDSPRKKSA